MLARLLATWLATWLTPARRARTEKELAEAVRAKDAGRDAQCRQALAGDGTALASSLARVAQWLCVWTDEVTKRGRVQR